LARDGDKKSTKEEFFKLLGKLADGTILKQGNTSPTDKASNKESKTKTR
jgi:hypothetical protein